MSHLVPWVILSLMLKLTWSHIVAWSFQVFSIFSFYFYVLHNPITQSNFCWFPHFFNKYIKLENASAFPFTISNIKWQTHPEVILRTFVLTVPQECHRWQCYPIWVRHEAVIIALVAAAVSWHFLLELAGWRYILIRLSLGHKHMHQVLFECIRQPKGQSCAPSVSKCIRINVSAELSKRVFPWVIQMAVRREKAS